MKASFLGATFKVLSESCDVVGVNMQLTAVLVDDLSTRLPSQSAQRSEFRHRQVGEYKQVSCGLFRLLHRFLVETLILLYFR